MRLQREKLGDLRRFPDLQRRISASRDESFAVGADRQAREPVLLCFEGKNLLALFRVPDCQKAGLPLPGAVPAAAEDPRAVRAPGHALDRGPLAFEGKNFPAFVRLPY